jgi:hypothetical protein
VSRERQQRRAQREAALAQLSAERVAAAERHAKSDRRKARVLQWVPKVAPRQSGLLADRKARQFRATVAVLIAVNLLVFALTRDGYLTGFTVVASLLGAPIVHMMLFGKK